MGEAFAFFRWHMLCWEGAVPFCYLWSMNGEGVEWLVTHACLSQWAKMQVQRNVTHASAASPTHTTPPTIHTA